MPDVGQQLARALQSHTTKHIAAAELRVQIGVVLVVDPLQVELTNAAVVLTDDDLILTASARAFSALRGFEIGDNVLLHKLPTGDYLVSGVLTERELTPVLHYEATELDEQLPTDHGTIVATIPAFDKNGDPLGSVLVYDEQTIRVGLFGEAETTPSADPTYSGAAVGTGTQFVSPDKHIVRKVPLYDAAGVVLGYVPVFSSLA